jgi:hypothetical protein
MSETLSFEELKKRVRTGWQLTPTTPRLCEAAREVIRPSIERMRGEEIIYRCRVPWLMRIISLRVDDQGFRAVAEPVREIRDSSFSVNYENPFKFFAKWEFLHMCGSAICMAMITDHFYMDPAVVAEVKAAGNRNAPPSEIAEILSKASNRDANEERS